VQTSLSTGCVASLCLLSLRADCGFPILPASQPCDNAVCDKGIMSVKVRAYNHSVDYKRVDQFLRNVYEPTDRMLNWLQPRWEYMHAHPFIENVSLEEIAVYEDEGEIIGLAHPEDKPAFIHFQRKPGYDEVLPLMFDYADRHFGGPSIMLQRDVIGLFVGDFDEVLAREAIANGYEMLPGYAEGYSKLSLDIPIPAAPLPDGFRLQSLADENDQPKINRCLWRGFNHEGEIPREELARPAVAQSAPNFRKDLTIVAVAPDGEYVSYAGIWLVADLGFAYVEPVATDPDYRRIGLGRAAVLESIRRVQAEGAEVTWVGSDQPFYKAMGFETKFQRNLWVKWLD
jgi:predicted N-acetyltransferase YhbS